MDPESKDVKPVFTTGISLIIIVFFVICTSVLLIKCKPILTNITGPNIGYFVLLILFIIFGFLFGFLSFYFSQHPDLNEPLETSLGTYLPKELLTEAIKIRNLYEQKQNIVVEKHSLNVELKLKTTEMN